MRKREGGGMGNGEWGMGDARDRRRKEEGVVTGW